MEDAGSIQDAGFLREYLAQRDVPCPSCGYNLRGLTASRCPECDQGVMLRLHLSEPRLAGWVGGLVGLAAGAGFSGLLLMYAAITILRGRGPGRADAFIYLTIAGFLIEGAALFLWIRFGGRIRRAPTHQRAWLIAACWATSLANLLAFSLLAR